MRKPQSCRILAASSALALAAACGPGQASGGEVHPVSDLDALVAAAQEEGALNIYATTVDTVNNALADAFEQEYGIKVSFTKLSSTKTATRFQSEASTGKIFADNVLIGCAQEKLLTTMVDKGWATRASELDLPALRGPEKSDLLALNGTSFVAMVLPIVIGYNTKELANDVPKTWQDLTKPIYKGRIVVPNPDQAAVYTRFLGFLAQKFGDDFLRKLAGQDLDFAASATSRNQLAAGNNAINFPQFETSIGTLRDDGAPVDTVVPPVTPAVQMCLTVSSPNLTPHPNAARLFAHFLTTPKGAATVGGLAGPVSPYDEDGLPPSINPMPTSDEVDQAHLFQLLGFEG